MICMFRRFQWINLLGIDSQNRNPGLPKCGTIMVELAFLPGSLSAIILKDAWGIGALRPRLLDFRRQKNLTHNK